MPTQGLGAGAEGAGSQLGFVMFTHPRRRMCVLLRTSGLAPGLLLGPSHRRPPGQAPNVSPRWLCPLAVAGAAISLPQHLRKRLAEQSGSGSAAACPRRAAVAVGGPVLSPESPFSIPPRRDHPSSIPPSFPGTDHPASPLTADPVLRSTAAVSAEDGCLPIPSARPPAPCHLHAAFLGSSFFFIIIIISGSKLRRGRCSCSHQP